MSDKLTLKLKDKIVEVTMDDNGRYCLNDLFKASESGDNKKPTKYLRNKDCGVDVINVNKRDKSVPFPEDFDSYVVITGVGRASKTFAPLKVVYKYASFISKDFENAVYDAFTKLTTGDAQEAANIASSVTLTPEIIAKYQKRYHKLMSLISEKYPDNKYIHSNINRLIGKAVTGYTPKELTGGFDTTVEYITAHGHLPAMNALIATLETITMLIAGGATDYHLIAATLQVKTGKNQSILEMLD